METNTSSNSVKLRVDQSVSKLRAHGFSNTPQRLAALRVLAASEGHPSVEMVYKTVRREFPTTSIATIYRTIYLLKQINEVLEIAFPGGKNRYDGNKPFPILMLFVSGAKKLSIRILEP